MPEARKFWMGIVGTVLTSTMLSGAAAYVGAEKALSDVTARTKALEDWKAESKSWQQDKERKWEAYAETKGEITIRLKVIEANQENIQRKLDEIYRIAKKN